MATDFDVIVIGSGFGGAITSARLAEAGYKVLILERGRRWAVEDFPRKPTDPWVWDAKHPERRHGWFDFRIFPNMSVVQGAGVGGGSLVYANISVTAKPDTFDAGWPAEVTFAALEPCYDRVAATMAVAPVPQAQWPNRTKLLKEAAEKVGFGGRFRPLDLAVTFDPAWTYQQPNPHDPAKSKTVTNAQGQTQGTCVHLGDCDIGCPVRARNTLDLNYIPIAEKHGAIVKPLHLVRHIRPIAEGYSVSADEIAGGAFVGQTFTSRLVVVAAGSLGSTELLLRAKGDPAGLPQISAALGKRWSSNGDFLTPAIHLGKDVNPMRGPTITAAVDLLDGAFRQKAIFIEDGGLPDVADAALRERAAEDTDDPKQRLLIESIRQLSASGAFRHVMPWFAQSRDAADGTLSLKNGDLFLDWDAKASAPTIDAVVAMHQKMALATGGVPLTPLTWTLGRDLITPHPLGGCNMAATAATGVVDHKGEVFGCPNLFVADGAIVPKALGLNPSKTIGALAERIASIIVAEQR
jgi:cholesterol oxidase